ncbi:ParA family partition ATPase [Burkholderia cenocepacia]|uniref:ParA family partition ATPase n=1 Tax=Burkholderia cenocepacia TaxID=95486 RepID=UPI00285507D0|nr:ParA family partition ATPase [Burkholderia cenocepacia]MDR8057740.1 cobyrinic acid a,c-diamide synthase [Burkholderia cenocepacia]MDR8062168.1 cobyrinic acid a,c-diamide synthase [Burkholderia cenocepacia]
MKPMTIVACSTKGGTSKTTTCVNLPDAIAQELGVELGTGFDAQLFDLDPQMSASEWHEAAGDGARPFPVLACPRPTLDQFLATVREPRDLRVFDCPGIEASNPATIAAVRAADFVLLPIQPSAFDMWANAKLVDLVRTRMDITDGRTKAAFLITQASPRSRLARLTREALQETGIPVLDTVMHARKSYVEAAANGVTVFQYSDAQAQAEMRGVAREVLAMLATCHGTNRAGLAAA